MLEFVDHPMRIIPALTTYVLDETRSIQTAVRERKVLDR